MRIIAGRAALVLLALACAACGGDAQALPNPALPERILPPVVHGFAVEEEKTEVFKTSYGVSLVADGKVFTLRRGGNVQASLQISTLKRKYNTKEDEVRRGIRASIEQGRYRWFKVSGQWVGEQRLPEVGLYLWMPPGGHLFEVLVVKPELGIPTQLLEAIIQYQRGPS